MARQFVLFFGYQDTVEDSSYFHTSRFTKIVFKDMRAKREQEKAKRKDIIKGL